MPGFTFEKIAPPEGRKPTAAPVANERPRGPVVRIIERFVELRVRRKLRAGAGASERREPSHDEI